MVRSSPPATGTRARGTVRSRRTAIECPLDRLQLTLSVPGPARAEDPDAWTRRWLTFGFDEDLDEAAAVATAAMPS